MHSIHSVHSLIKLSWNLTSLKGNTWQYRIASLEQRLHTQHEEDVEAERRDGDEDDEEVDDVPETLEVVESQDPGECSTVPFRGRFGMLIRKMRL